MSYNRKIQNDKISKERDYMKQNNTKTVTFTTIL